VLATAKWYNYLCFLCLYFYRSDDNKIDNTTTTRPISSNIIDLEVINEQFVAMTILSEDHMKHKFHEYETIPELQEMKQKNQVSSNCDANGISKKPDDVPPDVLGGQCDSDAKENEMICNEPVSSTTFKSTATPVTKVYDDVLTSKHLPSAKQYASLDIGCCETVNDYQKLVSHQKPSALAYVNIPATS